MVIAVILLAVLATSAGGYLLATRGRRRLPPRALARAASRALETLGVALAFLAANAVVGIGLVVSTRALSGEFLSAYTLNDVTLALVSLVQGLVYRWWHAVGQAGPARR